LNAWLAFWPAVGSLAVTAMLPRLTQIQPVSPSKRTPLGSSSLTNIVTPLAYFRVMEYLPWTFQKLSGPGKVALASTATGPVCSVPMAQWAMSR